MGCGEIDQTILLKAKGSGHQAQGNGAGLMWNDKVYLIQRKARISQIFVDEGLKSAARQTEERRSVHGETHILWGRPGPKPRSACAQMGGIVTRRMRLQDDLPYTQCARSLPNHGGPGTVTEKPGCCWFAPVEVVADPFGGDDKDTAPSPGFDHGRRGLHCGQKSKAGCPNIIGSDRAIRQSKRPLQQGRG